MNEKLQTPTTFASRRAEREESEETIVSPGRAARLAYNEPFTIPARVPVKDRQPQDNTIVVERVG